MSEIVDLLCRRMREAGENARRGMAVLYLANPSPTRTRLRLARCGVRQSRYRPRR